MYMFFDSETSDLPRRWDAPATDVDNWPRVVQLAWVTCDAAGKPGEAKTRLIRPDGFEIAPAAALVHGISTKYATEHGVPLRPVLDDFAGAVESAEVVVAHNVAFDSRVVGAEFVRAAMANVMASRPLRCTMKESTEYCNLPGRYGNKWPKLSELHAILFGQPVANAHDAAADCLACMRCFFRLREVHAIA